MHLTKPNDRLNINKNTWKVILEFKIIPGALCLRKNY